MEKVMASFAIQQGSECPYWSHGDELAFSRWLESIPGVKSVKGEGQELIVTLRSNRISAVALRELIALHTRYNCTTYQWDRWHSSKPPRTESGLDQRMLTGTPTSFGS